MKKSYISCKWDDRQIDLILHSFSCELIRINYQIDILNVEEDCIEYNELISYKATIESSMEKILGKLQQMQFDQFCDIQRQYRFLKLSNFKSSKKVRDSELVSPIFVNDEPETPFDDIDFEGILTAVDEEDAQIINGIGREKLIKILKENHIGIHSNSFSEMSGSNESN